MKIKRTSIRLVREEGASYDAPEVICRPQDAAATFESIFQLSEEAQEVLVALFLSTKNEVIGASEISRGSLAASMVPVPEIFKAALLHNAASLMMAHNHPSGDPIPSKEDLLSTKRMKDAGRILGIEVLDHIVIGNGTAISLVEWGQANKKGENEHELANRLKFLIHPMKMNEKKHKRREKKDDNPFQVDLF
jgi:DNA repair protein RadC